MGPGVCYNPVSNMIAHVGGRGREGGRDREWDASRYLENTKSKTTRVEHSQLNTFLGF